MSNNDYEYRCEHHYETIDIGPHTLPKPDFTIDMSELESEPDQDESDYADVGEHLGGMGGSLHMDEYYVSSTTTLFNTLRGSPDTEMEVNLGELGGAETDEWVPFSEYLERQVDIAVQKRLENAGRRADSDMGDYNLF